VSSDTAGESVPVRLMNTIWADRGGVHDALTTAGDLSAWLGAVDPQTGPIAVRRKDLARFRTLRDALRRLAALLTDDDRAAAASATTDVERAVADVNAAAAAAPVRRVLAHRSGTLALAEAGSGNRATRALATIAQESIELLGGADGRRLRACHGPGCVLYFLKDHPRREWCSAACGNRMRVSRHYHRHAKRPG
jgi:predicted RNA-binding Zn ribbon-like protein